MSINPFNITNQLLPDSDNDDDQEGESICIICQENINNSQCYTLPECQHKFHTHCIVTWFRSQQVNIYDVTNSTSACPLCGNKGINNITEPNLKRYAPKRVKNAEKVRKKFIINYANKNECPKELKNLIKQMETKKDKLKNAHTELKELKETMKNEDTNYVKVKKKFYDLKRKIWNLEDSLESTNIAITYFPIIPIIIPIPIDIN